MISNNIEISSLRVKFQDILNSVDKAIKTSKPIQISRTAYNQKNNNITFLKWLEKHNIIKLITVGGIQKKKSSIKSRKRKIEISLQLKSLGFNITDIAKRFKVKTTTAQGYLKSLGKYNHDYVKILKFVLFMKGIEKNMNLFEFPEFPIRISIEKIKNNLSMSDFNNLETIINRNNLINKVVGKNLGTSNLSILLPEK